MSFGPHTGKQQVPLVAFELITGQAGSHAQRVAAASQPGNAKSDQAAVTDTPSRRTCGAYTLPPIQRRSRPTPETDRRSS